MKPSWFPSRQEGERSSGGLLKASEVARDGTAEDGPDTKSHLNKIPTTIGYGGFISSAEQQENLFRAMARPELKLVVKEEVATVDFPPATDFEQHQNVFSVQGLKHEMWPEDAPAGAPVDDDGSTISLNLGLRTYFATGNSLRGSPEKRSRPNPVGWIQVPSCQAQNCNADLSNAKQYYRRHKVCEMHSKAPTVITGGKPQRFCQQCSRFHVLSEFDDEKRSCRKRLEDHNRRRRKSNILITRVLPPGISLMNGKVQQKLCIAGGGSHNLRTVAQAVGTHLSLSSLGGICLQTHNHALNDPSLPWFGSAPLPQSHTNHFLVAHQPVPSCLKMRLGL